MKSKRRRTLRTTWKELGLLDGCPFDGAANRETGNPHGHFDWTNVDPTLREELKYLGLPIEVKTFFGEMDRPAKDGGNLSNRISALTVPHSPHYPTQMLSTDSIDLSVSNFSLQPLPSSKCDAYQPMPIACPMAVLSSITSDIVQFQRQLDRSTDQQSVYHQQLLEQLVQLLREQSEAKKRDEQALAELAAAKERDEEMYRMQQQTIDRLIVAQQRIEAVLVQTYELHEYPIPRLFVILPDSYETWDLRSLLLERFRLYFLCECGEECRAGSSDEIVSSDQSSTTTAATPTSPIPVKN
ncbi:hypothetical protein BGX29_001281, partial [Mortierella sp. GBA35]